MLMFVSFLIMIYLIYRLLQEKSLACDSSLIAWQNIDIAYHDSLIIQHDFNCSKTKDSKYLANKSGSLTSSNASATFH
jgi:hypothetical protein